MCRVVLRVTAQESTKQPSIFKACSSLEAIIRLKAIAKLSALPGGSCQREGRREIPKAGMGQVPGANEIPYSVHSNVDRFVYTAHSAVSKCATNDYICLLHSPKVPICEQWKAKPKSCMGTAPGLFGDIDLQSPKRKRPAQRQAFGLHRRVHKRTLMRSVVAGVPVVSLSALM